MLVEPAAGNRLVLLSNGYAPGDDRYLHHALDVLAQVFDGVRRVVFVPYAQRDADRHTRVVAEGLRPLGVQVLGVHEVVSPRSAVESAQAVMVGGGNAFRLLASVNRVDLLSVIRRRVADGMPYVGTSAGTNLACPTIRTTNDMPIVQPPTLSALGLIPFQINPHYPPDEPVPGRRETRDKRLREFLEENDVPVLGLQEGSWLQVVGPTATLGGVNGGRLFHRARPVHDLPPGADVSHLLRCRGGFDNPID